MSDVLFQCLRHFVHLDESNAAIHCVPVRYSPITFRLAEHLADQDSEQFEDPIVQAVLNHVGQYEEDKGR